jgi:hypothetical protein
VGTEPVDYCREIEAYLCRKNDGHLVRVVGPSFELVSRWHVDGVPLKVAFQGIDRYFERYYRQGPRRRPVRVDFCDADVRDVFDEWRRAVGLTRGRAPEGTGPHDLEETDRSTARGTSLRAHIERAALRLTNARATGALGADADAILDRLSRELDGARASAHGVRGEARRALIDRLKALDAELLSAARAAVDADMMRAFEREADEELVAFRERMVPDAYGRARAAAVDRLVRERLALPTLTYA